MQGEYEYQSQQGNILISAIMILIVMNLLGLGLVQASVREVQVASYKTVNSTVFQITESCSQDAQNWIKNNSTAPDTDYNIEQTDLDYMLTGSETTAQLKKLTGYSFSCDVEPLISKISDSGTSVGSEIGSGGGYGSASESVLKYYYQITSTGEGPKSSTRTTYTIVSAWWE